MSSSNPQAGYGTAASTAVERLRQLSNIIGYTIVEESYSLWLEAITHSSHVTAVKGANGGLARLGDLAMKTVQTAILLRAGMGDDSTLHTEIIQGRLSHRPLEIACKTKQLENLAYYNMPKFSPRCSADLVQAIIGAVYIDCVSRNFNPMEKIETVMNSLNLLYHPEQEQGDEQGAGQEQEQEQDAEATDASDELTSMYTHQRSSILGHNPPSSGQRHYQPIANQVYHQPSGNSTLYQRNNNQGYNLRGSSQGQYQQTNYGYY